MKTNKIFCKLCGQLICEFQSIKKNTIICSHCKSSTKITIMGDGSIHSIVYPYELALKKRPDLYLESK